MQQLGFKQAPKADLLVQPAKLQNYKKDKAPAVAKLASEKNHKTPNNESLNANLKGGILDVDCLQSQQNMQSKGLDVASGNGRLVPKYGNL